MDTKLISFENSDGDTLRGILTLPEQPSSTGVLFVSGFERNCTTEPKFKNLADLFGDKNISSFRFDFSGSGLSDGDFSKTTIGRWYNEFSSAYDAFQTRSNIDTVYVVAHSLGACVVGSYMSKNPESISKAVMISPALNQKDLMRYWFVTGSMKKQGSDVEVTWDNYKDYLDEDALQEDVSREDKMMKAHYIMSDYFKECSNTDYSSLFESFSDKVLHIHGDSDSSVPLESLNISFPEKIIVSGGDHDIHRPNQFEQWSLEAVNYLS